MVKKVLIIGYGSIGKRHVSNLLKETNFQIIIYTKQKNLKIKNKRVRIFNNLTKCLDEEPFVGFITNETSLHVSSAITLAKNDIHLFLEKPLSNSIKNISNLKRIVYDKKLLTLIGCNFRFHPCLKKIKQLIDNKKIGKILSVQVESGSYLPDWHPYENYSKGYAARDNLGGGISLTCIHEIDYLYWFFGDVKELFAINGKFSNLKISTDDLAAIIMRFKNNIIGEVHLDYFQKPDFKRCKIKGSKGVIYWDSDINQVQMFDIVSNKWKKVFKPKNFTRNDMYIEELRHLKKCLRTKSTTINDLNEGIKTLEISLAIKRSSKLRKMVKI